MPIQCPVCLSERRLTPTLGDSIYVECPRCGNFNISRTASACLLDSKITPRQRVIASSLIRDRWQGATIDSEDMDSLLSANDIPILEKADRLLLAIYKATHYVGDHIDISLYVRGDDGVAFTNSEGDPEFFARCWAIDLTEIKGLLSLLEEFQWISREKSPFVAVIAAQGWKRIEQLQTEDRDKKQGFVAMWFHESMNEVYSSAIAPAIEIAGYAPLRIDRHEHAGKIDDEIILQIRRSRFLVADVTKHRGGVYYEAGFAHGLGQKVFWSCRDDHFADLHFDIRQYNCIKWNPGDLNSFRDTLARRIEAELGQGPLAKQR